jgi:uncharacterized protein YjgD (DUF1641 family)
MLDTSPDIEDRLARMEKTLEKIAQGVDQAPTFLSMATDSLDELIYHSNEGPVRLDDRLRNGLQLLGRLSDPNINASMNQLLDLMEQGPGMLSMGMDMLDEAISKSNESGTLLDDRIEGFKILIDKLSDPAMLDNFTSLIKFSHQASGLAAMSMDMFDEFMKDHRVINAQSLDLLMKAGEAVTEAQQEPPAKVGGIFGLLKALRDPSRQKALGFVMNILKNLGKKL